MVVSTRDSSVVTQGRAARVRQVAQASCSQVSTHLVSANGDSMFLVLTTKKKKLNQQVYFYLNLNGFVIVRIGIKLQIVYNSDS